MSLMPTPGRGEWYRREVGDRDFENALDAYEFYKVKRQQAGDPVLSYDEFLHWSGLYGSDYAVPMPPTQVASNFKLPSLGDALASVRGPMGPQYGSFDEFRNSAEIAQVYANIYREARAELQRASGERRRELEKIANQARNAIVDLSKQVMPEIQKYGKADSERLAALQNSANYTVDTTQKGTQRELDLAMKDAVAGLQSKEDMRMAGLYEQQLAQQAADARAAASGANRPTPNSYEVAGIMARIKAENPNATQAQLREGATSILQQHYGISYEEAWGRVNAELGGEPGSYGDAQSVVMARANEMGANRYNVGMKEGKFLMSERYFVSEIKKELAEYMKDHPGMSRTDLGWSDDDIKKLYLATREEYENRWSNDYQRSSGSSSSSRGGVTFNPLGPFTVPGPGESRRGGMI